MFHHGRPRLCIDRGTDRQPRRLRRSFECTRAARGGGITKRHRTTVASTNISALAYDEETSLLEVEFRNGSRYRYFVVPARIYAALRLAPSKGTYFNAFIRGRYAFTKL